jgi:hypothetical protein
MSCTISVLLEPGLEPGNWRSCALDMPGAEVIDVSDDTGAQTPFERLGNVLNVRPDVRLARARLRLRTDLIPASALSDAKVNFDQQKLASDERAGRRTLWISLASAIISAAATMSVALIARPGQSNTAAALPTLHQLLSCQESLDRLRTLSALSTQTLGDLRAAVQHHDDACRDALKAAVDSSPSS